jgi:hypothetical protein
MCGLAYRLVVVGSDFFGVEVENGSRLELEGRRRE